MPTYKMITGVPGCLSQLSVWLRIRSWSHSLWVPALHQALCWQLGAWSLLQILCLLLSLPLLCSCSVSLCLSKINIGAPGWLSRLNIRLRLRSWSHGSRILSPRVGLCADSSGPGACFGFCIFLSFCSFPAHTLSLSLSKIKNKH